MEQPPGAESNPGRARGFASFPLLMVLLQGMLFGEGYFFTTLAGSAGNRGSADGVGASARFNSPRGVAVDADGFVYVADRNETIRKIAPDGTVTTFAGLAGVRGSSDGVGRDARFSVPLALAVDIRGDIFVADAGNGTIRKITRTGLVTTVARNPSAGFEGAALFEFPVGIAVDAAGNIFVADAHEIDPPTVQKISPSGQVSTLATLVYGTTSYNISGLAVDATGNVLFAETPTGRIQSISPDGIISTFSTGFSSPYDIAIDAAGSAYVANASANSIVKTNAAGVWVTSMGRGGVGDGRSDHVRFSLPTSVAVDSEGNIYVADTSNHTIRKGVPIRRDVTRASRLANLSVRTNLDAGHPLVGGFVSRGGARPLLVRAIGPGLSALLPAGRWSTGEPRLEIFDTRGLFLVSNDNWSETANGVALALAFQRVGAFPLLERSRDAALMHEIRGALTTHVTSVVPGVCLLEVYDAGSTGEDRLISLSARYRVGTGEEALIAGFVIAGRDAKTVLIRGVGPALAAAPFSVAGVVGDPKIEVFNRASQEIAENDNWPASLTGIFEETTAFNLTANGKDAAVLLTLVPGLYTVVLSAADGNAGEGLIEIYEVQ